jgi:hypothetical protein
MSEVMTPLALLVYGTAAVVGVQLVASSLGRLSGLLVRRNGRPIRPDEDPLPQAAMAGLVLLVVGLFLLLQGVVVTLWTFG